MRLDEEKLEALRSWGERLRQASGEESAAVGRAILMLVEEIDRLQIELGHAGIQSKSLEPVAASGSTDTEQEPLAIGGSTETAEEPVVSSLHARLQRVLRRDAPAEPVERSGADAEGDGATSPQAWIESLRRQK
jgi:hypothetical protein